MKRNHDYVKTRLVSFLSKRKKRGFLIEELMDGMGISRSTIYSYVSVARSQGISITSTKVMNKGVRTTRYCLG